PPRRTSMNRRAFLAASAAVAASPAGLRADDNDFFPIVDTHQHLWDLNQFRLPWLKDAPTLAKDHRMAEYREATADLGTAGSLPVRVVKTVDMEVDVDPAQQVAEAEFVLGLCRKADNPMVAAVVSGRPASDEFGKYLDRFRGSAYLKGVRQVLHGKDTPAG